MVKDTGTDGYTSALNILIERRDKLALELEQCDQGIAVLTSLAGLSGIEIATSKANLYRAVKSYDAALAYMEEKKLDEIGIQELADAIVARGRYLGKRPERNASNLSISITQNNNQGRKKLVIRDGKVARNN